MKQCTSVNHRSRARLGANVRAQPVTPSRAANLSLALVGAGWLAAVYGAFSQLGDPAPWVPSSEIEMQRRVSMVILFFGVFALACVLPIVAMLVYAFR